jgi:hypothetical protein
MTERSRAVRREAQSLAGAASARVRRQAAVAAYRELLPLIRRLRSRGLSFGAVAARLNQLGHRTRNGKPWRAMQVHRVVARAAP